jgi:hypothetical protein
MANPSNYRRPAFIHRPWTTGGLYDLLASRNVLHCDVYVYSDAVGARYLAVDWTEGGRKAVARDMYWIEDDGLTPVWALPDAPLAVYWTPATHGWMRRVHATALRLADEQANSFRWSTVSFLAHYVHVEDSDPWRGPNNYRFKARVAGK